MLRVGVRATSRKRRNNEKEWRDTVIVFGIIGMIYESLERVAY
jgi:hypothetical protein